MDTTQMISSRFASVEPFLDERNRRLVAAAEAQALGRGGITNVAKATGLSRKAIRRGLDELSQAPLDRLPPGRIRRGGAGRKPLVTHQPGVRDALNGLVESTTRGDPESPLKWTCKSVRILSCELKTLGFRICPQKVADLLHDMGYSLQSNRKTLEGANHPDRDAQFHHIQAEVRTYQDTGQPVISVDTKKKELVGEFKNNGAQWSHKGEPVEVKVHDFLDPELGRVAPYGIYDLTNNSGWVNVGTDHDTAAFAVESIRCWWNQMGRACYPEVTQLLITADGGGSNSSRSRLWKCELQRLADETGLSIGVCHFPPGTSKWNKVEHRLFSRITQNWRGRPLVSHEVVVNLIAATRTTTGLNVACQLDTNTYPAGVKVSDAQLAQVNLHRESFHGEWNYVIKPSQHGN
jgi:hypothetical protein